jgi:hypothetical protein
LNPGITNKTMLMKPGITYIVLGTLLVLIDINSVLTIPFDKSKGLDYLIGEILFNVFLGIAGIVLIIAGLVRLKKGKRKKY